MAALATPALAGSTGGVSAASPTPAAPATPAVPLHTAPITAPTSNVAYSGPVYEKTSTGEVIPYQAPAPAGQASGSTATNPTGGSPVVASPVGVTADAKPDLLVPGTLARYVNGLAAAPMSAPAAVQEIVWAGNQLIGLPYIFGGGHASFVSPGYDCSGTVSFALHGASLLATPEDSSEFEVWGSHGVGRWVTIFSNPGHAYMTVAGLRLDTSAADDPTNEQGPRWRPLRQGNVGFTVRHPLGL
jgi:cell wall-associated NlpC family hydrolase